MCGFTSGPEGPRIVTLYEKTKRIEVHAPYEQGETKVIKIRAVQGRAYVERPDAFAREVRNRPRRRTVLDGDSSRRTRTVGPLVVGLDAQK